MTTNRVAQALAALGAHQQAVLKTLRHDPTTNADPEMGFVRGVPMDLVRHLALETILHGDIAQKTGASHLTMLRSLLHGDEDAIAALLATIPEDRTEVLKFLEEGTAALSDHAPELAMRCLAVLGRISEVEPHGEAPIVAVPQRGGPTDWVDLKTKAVLKKYTPIIIWDLDVLVQPLLWDESEIREDLDAVRRHFGWEPLARERQIPTVKKSYDEVIAATSDNRGSSLGTLFMSQFSAGIRYRAARMLEDRYEARLAERAKFHPETKHLLTSLRSAEQVSVVTTKGPLSLAMKIVERHIPQVAEVVQVTEKIRANAKAIVKILDHLMVPDQDRPLSLFVSGHAHDHALARTAGIRSVVAGWAANGDQPTTVSVANTPSEVLRHCLRP